MCHWKRARKGRAFPENTERLSRPGLRLTDELELRFLENLREHGRTKGTISTYRRNLSKLRKYLPEDSNLDPAFLSSWQSELLEQGYSPGTVNSCTGHSQRSFGVCRTAGISRRVRSL